MVIAKPFLKWVGGKTQILETVLAEFPKEIKNYYEPFLGGGSVLLGLLSLVKAGSIKVTGTIYASDLNANLIALYKNIQKNPTALIEEVKAIGAEFEKCPAVEKKKKEEGKKTKRRTNLEPATLEDAKKNQEFYYYWIRKNYKGLTSEEKQSVKGSAMFLFLNKTCFRGVYREGPDGFNVPYGHYKNPGILEEEHIRSISELIQPVTFRICPFQVALEPVQKGDFVYLDPPYAPETETSFVGYTSDGFSLDNHKALFELCKSIHTKGAKFLMSNADVKLVKDSFPSPIYQTKKILCRRAINSKNPESTTNEVLIAN